MYALGCMSSKSRRRRARLFLRGARRWPFGRGPPPPGRAHRGHRRDRRRAHRGRRAGPPGRAAGALGRSRAGTAGTSRVGTTACQYAGHRGPRRCAEPYPPGRGPLRPPARAPLGAGGRALPGGGGIGPPDDDMGRGAPGGGGIGAAGRRRRAERRRCSSGPSSGRRRQPGRRRRPGQPPDEPADGRRRAVGGAATGGDGGLPGQARRRPELATRTARLGAGRLLAMLRRSSTRRERAARGRGTGGCGRGRGLGAASRRWLGLRCRDRLGCSGRSAARPGPAQVPARASARRCRGSGRACLAGGLLRPVRAGRPQQPSWRPASAAPVVGRLGRGLLGCGLLGRLGLFGLLGPSQSVRFRATTQPVGLCFDECWRTGSSPPRPSRRSARAFRRSSSRALWRARARACSSPKLVQPFVGVGAPDACSGDRQVFHVGVTLSNAFRNASSAESGTSDVAKLARIRACGSPRCRSSRSSTTMRHGPAPCG